MAQSRSPIPRTRTTRRRPVAVVMVVAGLAAVLASVVAPPRPAAAATGANFVATGHDMDFHCSSGKQCDYFKILVDKVRNGSGLPVLALDEGSQLTSALGKIGVAPVESVNPSDAAALNAKAFTDGSGAPRYSAIITASDATCGGCDNTLAGEANINARAADFKTFFNGGGGILALTAGRNLSTYYNFVPLSGLSAVAVTQPFTPTSSGAAIGITKEMANCCETHNSFNHPPPPFVELETDSKGLAETIAAFGASIGTGGFSGTTTVPGGSTGGTPPTDDGQSSCVYGDIDNLNFGFPAGFDVFSGNSTPIHSYPWTINPADAAGTDRIMVGSGAISTADGYSGGTKRPDNSPQALDISCKPGVSATNISMQLFVDDFQASVLGSKFIATINGRPWDELTRVLNSLNQTGPIGKLITVPVPPELLADVVSGSAKLLIDDATTHVGDGYAIDFVRVIINPKPGSRSGTLSGKVTDAATKAPISGASVRAGGVSTLTDGAGAYTLVGVPAGLATPTAAATGYKSKTGNVDLIAGASAKLDFELEKGSDSSGAPGGGEVIPTPPIGGPEPPPGLRGFTIVVGQREVKVGQFVTVPVYLVNTPNMANINFGVAFNRAVAVAEGTPVKGAFPPSALFAGNAGKAGVVLIGIAAKTGASGTGPVGYIGFRATGKPGDRTELTVSVTKVDDPSGTALPIDRMHGSITILDEGGGLPGDCNNDHRLDASDAMCALRMSVRLRPPDLQVDADRDGQVTSRDSTLILQKATV